MFIIIALLSLSGFGIAYYMWETTRMHKKMMCPLGHDCHAVVVSRYGSLFGIRNELWGMLAYLCLYFSSILAETSKGDMSIFFQLLLILIIIPVGVFSLMLVFAQFAILKKYCFWCMVANFINLVLFIIIMT